MSYLELVRKNRAEKKPYHMVEYTKGVKSWERILTGDEAEREWARQEESILKIIGSQDGH
jgi:hypothetical protein